MTVDLDSLLGRPGAIGGDLGWVGPLDRHACRRLACDGAVIRVMVSRHRQPTGQQPNGFPADLDVRSDHGPVDHSDPVGLRGRLRAARALLPPTLGGAATEPLELGRSTRVIQPAQRLALAVRDGGCVFPGCDRPLAWCDGHHLWHWLDGGPTDLDNLAMACRAHHRAVP